MTYNQVLEELSLTAFVKIYNKFTTFFAAPETREWTVKVNHCTYRDFDFELKGSDLDTLLILALATLNEGEPEYKRRREAEHAELLAQAIAKGYIE